MMGQFAQPAPVPSVPDKNPLGALLLRVLIDLAMRQPDPADRAAMLEVLKQDGWL